MSVFGSIRVQSKTRTLAASTALISRASSFCGRTLLMKNLSHSLPIQTYAIIRIKFSLPTPQTGERVLNHPTETSAMPPKDAH